VADCCDMLLIVVHCLGKGQGFEITPRNSAFSDFDKFIPDYCVLIEHQFWQFIYDLSG